MRKKGTAAAQEMIGEPREPSTPTPRYLTHLWGAKISNAFAWSLRNIYRQIALVAKGSAINRGLFGSIPADDGVTWTSSPVMWYYVHLIRAVVHWWVQRAHYVRKTEASLLFQSTLRFPQRVNEPTVNNHMVAQNKQILVRSIGVSTLTNSTAKVFFPFFIRRKFAFVP